ncbi:coadhesin-like [Orbicella faveolata]|uniref:coadhesin-like n=1 Tax=Orbicella faveolata TaxID=48498 RepID=UPI0009E56B5E|nr:coadhesin-like [Orbicella faveolata]
MPVYHQSLLSTNRQTALARVTLTLKERKTASLETTLSMIRMISRAPLKTAKPGCFSSAFKIISFPWRPGRVVTPSSLPSWNLKCFSLFSASAVDGGYSDWSKFSECNASCGRGVKIRKRSCNSPEPTNGRKDCSDLGPAMESEACNSFPCPVNGGYSQWSNFTACTATCGGGLQSRTRTCTNPLPCCGGINCEHLGPSEETKECGTCRCEVDGGWSEWCTFTPCSVTCGGGVRYRNRTCTNPSPQSGGQDCLGPASESQKCNTESCPIDGNYTEWTEWSDCSAFCGGGLQIRLRNCTNPPPQYDGKNCEKLGPADQKQECNSDSCPIDGNYTEWSEWTDCSITCGGGSQSRSRKCTNPPPQYGGKNCDELGPTNQTQECNPDPCRE